MVRSRISVGCLLASVLMLPLSAPADDLMLLDRSRPEIRDMLRLHFRTLAHKALDRRLERYESLKAIGQITEWQNELRRRFIESLGGFPERTPLHARVVGRFNGDGYSVEKVIYESLPGFLVTANLYLPKSEPPYPGVLFPCGHSENGKAAGTYQKACILLARNGCAALIFDPVGQGERKQLLSVNSSGKSTAAGRLKATSEHMVTGVAPILLGRSLAFYFIWDGIRSLDYLISRDDIDPRRIGCTGNSGGGNQTSYLMALDERILAAAPGNFTTTTRIKNDRPGPGDAEQNIFGQTAYGLDHADYLMMRAPRPALILSATRDFIPIEGTWTAFRQAKRIYGRMGFSERVDLAETDDRHGYNSELRVAMTRFMRKWLLGQVDSITEAEVATARSEQLQCTDNGQVLLTKVARSIWDLNLDEAERLRRFRIQRWEALDPREKRKLICSKLAARSASDIPEPTLIQKESTSRNGLQIERYILGCDDDLLLPALLFRSKKKVTRAVLYLHADGKHVEAGQGGEIEKLARDGSLVLAIDLAGIGESEMKPWRYGSTTGVLGPNAPEFFVAYMLGRSIVGLRSDQIIAAARFFQSRMDERGPVDVYATGELTVPTLHAAVLEPSLFGRVTLRRGLTSWNSVIKTPVTKRQLVNTVHGVLKHYDLPDLRRMLPPDVLHEFDAVDAAGKRIQ